MMKISIQDPNQWSIGIYEMTWDSARGLSFHDLAGVKNPVLSINTIDERDVQFVADPFLIREDGKFYMFFEIMHHHKGTIGLAESTNGHTWRYSGIVLDEPFHLSYPCVVKDGPNFYMIPECAKTESVRLYQALEFPFKWKFSKELIAGRPFVDTTVFRDSEKWWLFTSDRSNLYLYWSDKLEGQWVPNSENPIIRNDKSRSRPGGSMLRILDKWIVFFQDCSVDYGKALRLFEIADLDKNDFECMEIDNTFIEDLKNASWNRDGIHQLSHQKISEDSWLVAIDGKFKRKPRQAYIGAITIPITPSIAALYYSFCKVFFRVRRLVFPRH